MDSGIACGIVFGIVFGIVCEIACGMHLGFFLSGKNTPEIFYKSSVLPAASSSTSSSNTRFSFGLSITFTTKFAF
tara:strand:+ start:2835 stop:3059 length:225 start_codon:yes stop_codon:yes gene_type:complete